MSKTEQQFAIGGMLVTGALAVILKTNIAAWAVFLVGPAIIGNIYVQDYLYGKNRPSRKELRDMTSEQFEKRITDPKFARYVDRLFKAKKYVSSDRPK
jgi:hypothetical protein